MAKRRHNESETSSSRMTLAIMAFGAILIAALIVWALTRPVESATTVIDAGDTTAVPPVSPPVTEPLTTATTATTAAPVTPPMTTAADAPQVAPPVQPAAEDETAVPRIAVEDLREKMRRGEVTVVDVRDPMAFNASHIPGSINVPFSRVEGELDRLPRDKPIVTYCT